MDLLIMRHGIAEDVGQDGTDDGRQLTAKGIQKTTYIAKGLVQLGIAPALILASPKRRAWQTAQIIAEPLNISVTESQELAGYSLTAIIACINQATVKSLMLIGHEPLLGRLVEVLCAGTDSPNFLPMEKASCACLEIPYRPIEPGIATLKWLGTPHLLLKLAEAQNKK